MSIDISLHSLFCFCIVLYCSMQTSTCRSTMCMTVDLYIETLIVCVFFAVKRSKVMFRSLFLFLLVSSLVLVVNWKVSRFRRLTSTSMATGSSASMVAVVIGGTGATGKSLVQTLLSAKDKVAKVTVLGRRRMESIEGVDVSAEESQGRFVQHIEDLDAISDETVKDLCTGSHVFFNTLGTTRAIAGSAEAFRHIDYEIPVRLVKASSQVGVPHCSVLTAYNSNPNSWFLYPKTKGQLEVTVREMKFPYTSLFRPGLLHRGNSGRFIEKLALKFMKGLPVSTLAEAMFLDAWDYHTKQQSTATSEGEGATAVSDDVAIFYDRDIYRIQQDSLPKESS